jgi:hypothetical protein
VPLLSHDFELVLAGGLVSLLTTIVIMLVIHLLFRLDRKPPQGGETEK